MLVINQSFLRIKDWFITWELFILYIHICTNDRIGSNLWYAAAIFISLMPGYIKY